MYAVVRFADEQQSVSEVPLSWLSDENRKCWWPSNVKNVSVLITKAISPNPSTWIQHDVTVETTGLSLQTARKKAQDADYSSSDEVNRGRGMRVKLTNVASSSSDDNDYIPKKGWRQTTNVMLPPPPPLPKENEQHLQLVDISAMPVILEGIEGSSESISTCQEQQFDDNISPVVSAVSCTHGEDIAEINENIRKFTRLLTSINLSLTSINNRLEKLEKNHVGESNLDDVNNEVVDQFLPLKNVEGILEFNELLTTNNEAAALFKKCIRHVGGNSPKDSTNRILKRIFTNECAMGCSWMGDRHNFRVSTLIILRFVKEAVCMTYTELKENEFETVGSEWFRFAKQRFVREQKTEL